MIFEPVSNIIKGVLTSLGIACEINPVEHKMFKIWKAVLTREGKQSIELDLVFPPEIESILSPTEIDNAIHTTIVSKLIDCIFVNQPNILDKVN